MDARWNSGQAWVTIKGGAEMTQTRVFRAREILTMDRVCPEATHIAVSDDRILALGVADCAAKWGDFTIDNTLADAVLMPELVEGHAHLMDGAMWRYTYAGFHDRTDPDGRLWEGVTTAEAMIRRLQGAALQPAATDAVFA